MKTFATLICVLMTAVTPQAQEITVTGTVTDESNLPLTGVNVIVKGSNNGTQTDLDGKYELKAEIGQKLKFSYVGYGTVERKVKNKKPIDVQMKPSASLEEVVVLHDAVENESKNMLIRGKASGVHHSPPYPVNNQVSSNESYDKIEENIFKMVTTAPLSTFSIDVDKAGYSNIRRMINHGQKIPKDAVKIEEMINYFSYNYPQPKRNEPFSIITEVANSPWNTNTKLVKIGLKGKDIATENTPASNLVFLLDVSGSMNSENKLGLLKSAMGVLVDKLREEDKVSIVVYAGAAGTVLEPTNGNNKEKIMEAIDKLRAGGSTAGGKGIKLAYKIAEENFIKDGNNRVILATDGDFNVGASSDRAMEDLIEEKRESGVFLTCLGFGMGNYKDSKMETLADKGNGNHAYIDTMQEAKKVLGTEFFGTIYTIAKDVKLQVEFNPKKVQAYRLIGYENRLLNDEDFNDDTKDAGELGSGHTVTALYELIPVGVKSEYLKDIDDLKYTDTKVSNSKTDELLTVKFRYKEPDGDKSKLIVKTLKDTNGDIKKTSKDFQFSAAVALFGQQLRDSDFIATKSREDVIRLAEAGRGKDKEGYRAEFIRLVKSYK
tara:strand:+ start:2438 stop:4249 length:1812 start_codon:yes stop_codon:yes gene_type:complete